MAINSIDIEDFLIFSENLNLIVSVNDSDFVLVALNNIPMPDDFKFEVNDKYKKAISFYSDALLNKSINPEYIRVISRRVRESLSCYCYEDDILTYSRIHIVDKQKNRIDYENLTESVKHELSELIAVLRNALMRFEDTISDYNPEERSYLKYKATRTDLVEDALVCYEAEIFEIDKKMVSRNDFITRFAKMYGETIDNPSKIIDKIKNRINPIQFQDYKREKGLDFFKDLNNL